MGRKTGAYKFEKRRKELKRQKKREEKLAKKLDKGTDGDDEIVDMVDPDETAHADDTEEPTKEPE